MHLKKLEKTRTDLLVDISKIEDGKFFISKHPFMLYSSLINTLKIFELECNVLILTRKSSFAALILF